MNDVVEPITESALEEIHEEKITFTLPKNQMKKIVEAVLLASDKPLPLTALVQIFLGNEQIAMTRQASQNKRMQEEESEKNDAFSYDPETEMVQEDGAEFNSEFPETKLLKRMLKETLNELITEDSEKPYQIVEIASGYRCQIKSEFSVYISKLFHEKSQKYSRAFLETLAIIAYRQPVTRAEIEDLRGVSVSHTIFKNLQEREWIKIIGHRDAPGKPCIYGTTKQFLDDFNLKNLTDLPPLPIFEKALETQLELLPENHTHAALEEGIVSDILAMEVKEVNDEAVNETESE